MKKGILPSAESRFFWGGGVSDKKVRRHILPDNGDNRTRTYDPLHVKQMLSQLSYISMATIISDKMGFGKLFLKREKQKKKVHEKFIVNYWKGMIL